MCIFIYSLQKEIGKIIHTQVSEKGNLCFLFESLDDLFSTLREMKAHPDLLIMDYTAFNHDIFNIYDYLENIHVDLPVVFYNDPCLTRTSRIAHWKAQIDLMQNPQGNRDISKFDEIFEDLKNLVESDELAPCIKLMQKTQELPKSLKSNYSLNTLKELNKDYIEDFRKRANLPNNLFYLLSIFQRHQGIYLSLAEIKKIYEADHKKISENSLKVLISNLRKAIRLDRQCRFLINIRQGTYSFIRFESI